MAQKMVAHYEIRGKIGQGGMANVFLAYDTHMEREVALKVLDAYFAREPEFASRFEREAKTITSLEHSHIVPVYDYGRFKGLPYLVMRYMRGGSLQKRLKKEPLPLTETYPIVKRVASALDYAHTNGIIHRDLKPDNILFDRENNAFLADFGIVKLVESSTKFTQTGSTLGTPAYMSPEQAKAVEQIDHRSDIYSLGVILYEMLAGDIPYKADSNLGQAMMHVLEPVPRILEVNPALPDACDEIIQKAMAKDRNGRYTSAGELANAVGTVNQESQNKAAKTPPDTLIDEDLLVAQEPSLTPETVREQPTIEFQQEEPQQPSDAIAQETTATLPERDVIKTVDTAERKKGFLFMLPGITLMILLQLLPLLLLVYLGFTLSRSLSELGEFVGFENYINLFGHELFWQAITGSIKLLVSRSLVVLITWWILQRSWKNRKRLPLWLTLLAVISLPLFSPVGSTILWSRLLFEYLGSEVFFNEWIWVVVEGLQFFAIFAAIGLVIYALGQNFEGNDKNAQILSTLRNISLIILIAITPGALLNLLAVDQNFGGSGSLSLFTFQNFYRLLRVGYAAAGQTLQVTLTIIAAVVLWQTLRQRTPKLHVKKNGSQTETHYELTGPGVGLLILGFIPGIILATPSIWGMLSSGPGSGRPFSLAELPWGSWLLNLLISGLIIWLVLLPLSWVTAYGLSRWNGSSRILKSKIVFPFILSALAGVSVIFIGQFYLLYIVDGLDSHPGAWLPLIYSSVAVLAFALYFDGQTPQSNQSLIKGQEGNSFLSGLRKAKMMPWIIIIGIVATCWGFRTFFWPSLVINSSRGDFVNLSLVNLYSTLSISNSGVAIVMWILALPCSLAFGWATYMLLKEYSLSVEL